MKKTILLLLLSTIILIQSSIAQKSEEPKKIEVLVGAGYKHAFTLEGHIRVREFGLNGDLLEWEQLGMKDFMVPGIFASIEFNEKHLIQLNYDRIYFHSNKAIDRNIEFNGTIIDGSSGIDLSPSVYKRISL